MRQKGLDGENLASDFLVRKGYKIISKNFHSRFGEIDLVATDNKTLVFVEVKMRSNNLFGTPLEAITYSKLEKLKKTALYFITLNKFSDCDFRFDAVEIIKNTREFKINHVKNITL